MVFGSVCSGIEGASAAWLPLNWRCAWVAEIDPFCSNLLKYHYPEVLNRGDFTKIHKASSKKNGVENIDVLVGGTPCQSFSVAGRRGGLDDVRGNLTIEYLKLLGRLRPRWFVWENVPGVLSIDGGRTFGTVLGEMAKLGYGFGYRILDAQYFGVPQQRRRVFVVGHLGDWRRAAAVLFERHCLSGYPPPRREKREDVAGSFGGGTGERGWCPVTSGKQHAIAFDTTQMTSAANRSNPKPGDPCHPLASGAHAPAVAFTERTRADGRNLEAQEETAYAVRDGQAGGGSKSFLAKAYAVRRLTVVECARLQGFHDTYCHIERCNAKGELKWRKVTEEDARYLLSHDLLCEKRKHGWYTTAPADGPMYRALGNSFAVPVVRWVGQRIQMVDDMIKLVGEEE